MTAHLSLNEAQSIFNLIKNFEIEGLRKMDLFGYRVKIPLKTYPPLFSDILSFITILVSHFKF